MHYSSFLATAAVASVALAAPAPAAAPFSGVQTKQGSFTAPRVLNTNAQRPEGKIAIQKAFAKFGMNYTAPVATKSSFTVHDRHVSKVTKQLANLSMDPATQASVAALLNNLLAEMKAEGVSCSTAGAANAPAPAAATGTATVPAGISPSSGSVPTGGSAGAGSGSPTNGQKGEATAKPEQGGALYLTPVNIGGQTVNLDFDTGSSDLWVFDKTATGRGFDSKAAQGFQLMQGATFKISYGDGSSASGSVGTAPVKIGSASVSAQAVELAQTVSAQFQQDTTTDGLLGLAFGKLNTVTPQKQKTFYESIGPQLATNVFTANLLLDGSGEYEFGTIDKSKYTGTLQYTDIDSSQGFWQFTSSSYKVGNTVGQNTNANPAIADTGTSLLLVDDNVVTAYYAQVPGAQNDATQGGYTYPCSAKLPDFSVALGTTGEYVTVPGSAITYQAQGNTCFGGIQSNQNNPVQIYGDILLKTQFVVFDGTKPQIGFAPSAGATAAGAAPAAAAGAN